ncbi:MAG: hypothetical protein KAJ19_22305 [Gammaproteobacteria bacterium]|nr:hypothetical protein [Gammaproteobacteria bacterium]
MTTTYVARKPMKLFDQRLAAGDPVCLEGLSPRQCRQLIQQRRILPTNDEDTAEQDDASADQPWLVLDALLDYGVSHATHHMTLGKAFREVAGTPLEKGRIPELKLALEAREQERRAA